MAWGSAFRIERAEVIQEFLAELEHLVALFRDGAHHELEKAFSAWLRQVKLPNVGVRLPADRVYALQEVRHMLRAWTFGLEVEGRSEGGRRRLGTGANFEQKVVQQRIVG